MSYSLLPKPIFQTSKAINPDSKKVKQEILGIPLLLIPPIWGAYPCQKVRLIDLYAVRLAGMFLIKIATVFLLLKDSNTCQPSSHAR